MTTSSLSRRKGVLKPRHRNLIRIESKYFGHLILRVLPQYIVKETNDVTNLHTLTSINSTDPHVDEGTKNL